MYEQVFQFSARPFTTTPFVKHYFAASTMEQSLGQAKLCIDRASGPVVVIGDIGTGKSLFLAMLEEHYKSTLISINLGCARLETRKDLLQCVLHHLDRPIVGLTESELRLDLMAQVRPGHEDRPGMLLLVDDAESLDIELFDELRLIGNLVHDGQPRVRLVLAGRQMLDEKLNDPRVASFEQRIAGRCYLEPLTREETGAYVREHIQRVGGQGETLFPRETVATLQEQTQGIPRLINQVCDFALILAGTRGQEVVSPDCILEAWADVQSLPGIVPAPLTQDRGAARDDDWAVIEFGELEDSGADRWPPAAETNTHSVDSHDDVDEFVSDAPTSMESVPGLPDSVEIPVEIPSAELDERVESQPAPDEPSVAGAAVASESEAPDSIDPPADTRVPAESISAAGAEASDFAQDVGKAHSKPETEPSASFDVSSAGNDSREQFQGERKAERPAESVPDRSTGQSSMTVKSREQMEAEFAAMFGTPWSPPSSPPPETPEFNPGPDFDHQRQFHAHSAAEGNPAAEQGGNIEPDEDPREHEATGFSEPPPKWVLAELSGPSANDSPALPSKSEPEPDQESQSDWSYLDRPDSGSEFPIQNRPEPVQHFQPELDIARNASVNAPDSDPSAAPMAGSEDAESRNDPSTPVNETTEPSPTTYIDPFAESFDEEELLHDRLSPLIAAENQRSLDVSARDLQHVHPLDLQSTSDEAPMSEMGETPQRPESPEEAFMARKHAAVIRPYVEPGVEARAEFAPPASDPGGMDRTAEASDPDHHRNENIADVDPGYHDHITEVVNDEVTRQAESILQRLDEARSVSHETGATQPDQPLTVSSEDESIEYSAGNSLETEGVILEEIRQQRELLSGLQSGAGPEARSHHVEDTRPAKEQADPVVEPTAEDPDRSSHRDDSEMIIVNRPAEPNPSRDSDQRQPLDDLPVSTGRAARMDYQQLFDQLRNLKSEEE